MVRQWYLTGESAFRNVPVHPHDRHLLGMRWNGQLYIGTVLPFGLCSSPEIFNCIADALQWIAKQRGTSYLDHYLDDFITTGAPKGEECSQSLSILIGTCAFPRLSISKRDQPHASSFLELSWTPKSSNWGCHTTSFSGKSHYYGDGSICISDLSKRRISTRW